MAARPLNNISLCTGGGGLDLGVELAIPCARSVVLVEREAFAVARLVEAMEERLLAPAPIWSDVRTFRGRPWRGLVDGVFGGIPCQPHSVAGKRQGHDDERDLWSPARRIIVQSGAWWALIENVPGMLSAKAGLTPGAERVWRDLQRLGFQVEGGLFSAEEVGASHERERVFILAVADTRRPAGERSRGGGDLSGASDQAEGQGHERQRHGPADRHGGEALAHPDRAGQQVPLCGRRDDGEEQPAPDRGGGAVVHADGGRRDGWPDIEVRRSLWRAAAEWSGEGPLFPPGPDARDDWAQLLDRWPQVEPAIRRGADGMATRVDDIRLFGNGVVPLAAAYALRSLAADLARRSAGAAELVRMMGA